MSSSDSSLTDFSNRENWVWYLLIALGVVFVIALIPAIFWLILVGLFHPRDPSALKLNEVGDSFGIANAMVSGLAFAAIVVSLYQQGKDLGIQKASLAQSIKEMNKTAEATERMAVAQKDSNVIAALQLYRDYNEQIEEIRSVLSNQSADPDLWRGRFDIAENRFRIGELYAELSGKDNSRELMFDIEDIASVVNFFLIEWRDFIDTVEWDRGSSVIDSTPIPPSDNMKEAVTLLSVSLPGSVASSKQEALFGKIRAELVDERVPTEAVGELLTELWTVFVSLIQST